MQQGLAKSDESIVLLFYVNSFVWWCNFWLIGLIEPFSTFRVNLTSPEELHDVHGMNCQSIYFSEPLDWMKKQVEDKIKGRVRIYYITIVVALCMWRRSEYLPQFKGNWRPCIIFIYFHISFMYLIFNCF